MLRAFGNLFLYLNSSFKAVLNKITAPVFLFCSRAYAFLETVLFSSTLAHLGEGKHLTLDFYSNHGCLFCLKMPKSEQGT